MPRVLLFALPIVVLACSSEPPAQAPVAPQPSPDEAAGQAEIARLQANGTIVTPERAAAYQAEMQAQQKASTDAIAAVHAQQQAVVDARAEAQRKVCEDTRAKRLENVKLQAAAHLSGETRLVKNGKAIRSTCRIVEKKTGAMNVQHSGSGWRVSPEMLQDVQCKGALPSGVSKDDAFVVLARDAQGEKGPTGTMLEPDDHSPEDGMCSPFDAGAGLNLEPQWNTDDLEKLVAWGKPKT